MVERPISALIGANNIDKPKSDQNVSYLVILIINRNGRHIKTTRVPSQASSSLRKRPSSLCKPLQPYWPKTLTALDHVEAETGFCGLPADNDTSRTETTGSVHLGKPRQTIR